METWQVILMVLLIMFGLFVAYVGGKEDGKKESNNDWQHRLIICKTGWWDNKGEFVLCCLSDEPEKTKAQREEKTESALSAISKAEEKLKQLQHEIGVELYTKVLIIKNYDETWKPEVSQEKAK